MYDTLRELHRKFWKELPKPEVERQYDEAFRELMRRLEKSERKLVLRLLTLYFLSFIFVWFAAK